jgi:septum formation protein
LYQKNWSPSSLYGGKILEKPLDAKEAGEMLSSLSGREHSVLTAVCIVRVQAGVIQISREFTCATDVVIKNLTQHEIDSYIKTGEPFDKAGGYAAQGLGSFMVKDVKGSFSNVVGLPLATVADVLQNEFDVVLWSNLQKKLKST